MFFISGTVDLQGFGYRILSGGVGMPGPCSEGLVQGRDGGDLWVRITSLKESGSAPVSLWGTLPCLAETKAGLTEVKQS